MRSEHKSTEDEYDAFTKWRRLLHWRRGEIKRIKQSSHRRDRRAARRDARQTRERKDW
jgi:hypothetical protein